MLTGMMMMMVAAPIPPNPTRPTAPPGIETRALAVGATAPDFTLPDAKGGTYHLHAPAVVLFYRGHW